MMNLFALIPVKDPVRGKSRLAPLLGPSERRALNLALIRRTLQVCAEVFGAARTVVVTSSQTVREMAGAFRVQVVEEDASQHDLNLALAAAAAFAIRAGADGLVAIPIDLPLLSAPLLRAAIDKMPDAPGCVLVPDRRGKGTNLLAFAPPTQEIFAFGEPSLERHTLRSKQLGYQVVVHHCDRLALDLDLPEDYACLENTATWPL